VEKRKLVMPKVNGKSYPYTDEGKKKAAEDKKKAKKKAKAKKK
jgi:hypothetical protein